MKRTVRENIDPPYSLHDMNIIAFEAVGDTLILRTQYGMIKTTPPQGQPDGWVEFEKVRWDYSYVYILEHTGNIGRFTGQKMWLSDFAKQFENSGFSVMDETFGYNQTKLSGFLSKQGFVGECVVEIYHEGEMSYLTEE